MLFKYRIKVLSVVLMDLKEPIWQTQGGSFEGLKSGSHRYEMDFHYIISILKLYRSLSIRFYDVVESFPFCHSGLSVVESIIICGFIVNHASSDQDKVLTLLLSERESK